MSFIRRQTFVVLLAGVLGTGLYVWLPPQPRWSLTGRYHLCHLFADGSRVAAWDDYEIGSEPSRHMPGPPAEEHFLVCKGPVVLRDGSTGQPVQRLFQDMGRMHRCLFAPDDRYAVAAWAGKPLRFADIAQQTERNSGLVVAEHWRVDAGGVARPFDAPILSRHGELLLWGPHLTPVVVNIATGRLAAWPTIDERMSGEPLSATDDWFLASVQEPQGLLLWDMRNRQRRFLEGAVRGRISPDGRTLAAIIAPGQKKREGVLRLLALPHLNEVHTTTVERPLGAQLEFSPDGRRLVVLHQAFLDKSNQSNGSRLEFFDVASGRQLSQVDGDVRGQHRFSGDGRYLLLDGAGRAAVHEVPSGRLCVDRPLHFTRPRGFPIFCADSRYLVDCAEHRVEWSDLASGAVQASLSLPSAALPPQPATPNAVLTVTGPTAQEARQAGLVLLHGRAARLSAPLLTPLEELLQRWLPARVRQPSSDVTVLSVVDLQGRRLVQSLDSRDLLDGRIAQDGKTLVTLHGASDGERTLSCWDVPARTRWHWILGAPACVIAASYLRSAHDRRKPSRA